MARRISRHRAERPRRRLAVFSLAALAILGAAVWLAPAVLVLTSLRDRPLEAALSGIDGSVASGSARWSWLGNVEFHDVVLRDRAGRAAVLLPAVVVDKGILALVMNPRDLGVVRLVAPEALVEIRRGGSSLEDLLAPWLDGPAAGPGPRLDVEVVDATVELVDLERGEAWRIEDVAGVAGLEAGGVAGWTVGGRLRHAGRAAAGARPAGPPPRAPGAGPLDRTAVAARATAALARAGGFSASSPGGAPPRTMTLAAQRLPLGISSLVATRFGTTHLLDGLGDVRLDVEWLDERTRISGDLVGDELAVFRADTLAELVAIGRCEIPFDLSIEHGSAVVRKLSARSPLFRADASGRIRLPDGGSWEWAEQLAAADFAFAGEVDLAATSRSMPGGLTVRPDVRVTAGTLELAAAARPDGDDRVLEIRAAARDLAAVQAATDDRAERLLRWTEPFAAWLRGRSGRDTRFRIEEGRLTSAALELSAAGTAAESSIDWTLDLERLAAEAEEIVDLGGLDVAGTSRGRLDIRTAGPGAPTVVTVKMDLADFALSAPGRPAWKDAAMSIEAEAAGSTAGGTAVAERGHVVVVAADDRLEATLTGRVVVDAGAFAGGAALVRPAPAPPAADAAAISADCSLVGDVGRWHARLAPFLPTVPGLAIGGHIEASAAVAARGEAWQITRAGGEIERFTLDMPGRRIAEPRVVASAAGTVQPAVGRIEISSAEALSATLSLRTGGLAWMPAAAGGPLRGKLQWQADVGRLARWLVTPETADRWPAAGRAWGTLDLGDAAAGESVRIEATADALTLSTAPAGAGPGQNRPLWNEPRATLLLEVTRSAAPPGVDPRLVIDRLALASTTFSVAASGGIDEPATRRLLDLGGTVSYDWEQVSRLLVPWTAGRLRLVGAGGRPFALRVALGGPPPASPAARPQPSVVALPLPDDWLTAARGGAADAERAARLTVPAAAGPRPVPSTAELLRGAAVETSIAWQAGEIAGLPLAAGEVPVRLLEGQLALGPFDVVAAGGRIRAAPWMSLAARPREIVVPPGRIVDRVALTTAQGRRIASWLSPLVGHATRAEGIVSVDLAGARLPLDDPFAGDAAGQVIFDPLEVTPDATVQPLVNLLVRLQSAVDPRFALGEKLVLLRVRPDPVRVRLSGRRLWHEGLVLDTGAWTVKSGGSVGADGSLSMVVEVALRGEFAGEAPLVAQIMRTPLAIPLTGTVDRPTFDARAIDVVVGRIVENTAQAVINEGLGRGLEALFGRPAPPPAPAPLTLPP